MARKNYVLFKLVISGFIYEKREWVKQYYTREQLIDYIVSFIRYRGDNILDRLAPDMSEKTTYEHKYYDKTLYFIGRQTMKKREKVIVEADINKLRKDVEIRLDKRDKKEEQKLKERQAYERNLQSEFRKEPVSDLCYYRFSARHVHYYKNRRMHIMDKLTADELESMDTSSPKNKHKNKELYLDCYSYRMSYRDRNWKTSFKFKKQWDKHNKKHEDYIRHNKRSLSHFDIEDSTDILEEDFMRVAG